MVHSLSLKLRGRCAEQRSTIATDEEMLDSAPAFLHQQSGLVPLAGRVVMAIADQYDTREILENDACLANLSSDVLNLH
jgi:hypothetical protein